jgi:hypothetical protein
MGTGDTRIAVLFGEDGALAELPALSKVSFFEPAGQGWAECGSLPFTFAGRLGLCAMRQRLSEFMGGLGGVRAILARGFPGVSRDVLSRNGYVLYETQAFEEGVLHGILENLSEGGDAGGEGPVPTAPQEEGAGTGLYFLDLRLALNANPDLSTKKLLRPFLQAGGFRELRFLYDHFPPWLPAELAALGYSYEKGRKDGAVLVTVYAAGGRA